MSEWVYDQDAIDSIIALNELQDGDEIMFTHSPLRDHKGLEEGEIVVVNHKHSEWVDVGKPAWWMGSSQNHRNTLVAVCDMPREANTAVYAYARAYIARHNIKAWRRP